MSPQESGGAPRLKETGCHALCPTGQPVDLNYGSLKLAPDWDSLCGVPRFQALVASLAPELDERVETRAPTIGMITNSKSACVTWPFAEAFGFTAHIRTRGEEASEKGWAKGEVLAGGAYPLPDELLSQHSDPMDKKVAN